MPRGGRRAGAGRKPNSQTKKTREVAAQALSEGISPIEVMLKAMRQHVDAGDLDAAAEIAADAAPYCHPRLGTVTVKGDQGEPVRIVEEIVIVDANDTPPAPAQSPPG